MFKNLVLALAASVIGTPVQINVDNLPEHKLKVVITADNLWDLYVSWQPDQAPVIVNGPTDANANAAGYSYAWQWVQTHEFTVPEVEHLFVAVRAKDTTRVTSGFLAAIFIDGQLVPGSITGVQGNDWYGFNTPGVNEFGQNPTIPADYTPPNDSNGNSWLSIDYNLNGWLYGDALVGESCAKQLFPGGGNPNAWKTLHERFELAMFNIKPDNYQIGATWISNGVADCDHALQNTEFFRFDVLVKQVVNPVCYVEDVDI
ncbi:hypothetical protein HDV02_002818 [Globomyces sp. JEL0801]|nr:hypothetical protein HDV02_002818 [Globomyces sp. JEL0801]